MPKNLSHNLNKLESVSVSASAGSGKTYALVSRYINLLYHGISPENIYCLTFTKKAANEMKSKILDRLYEIANKENSACSSDLEDFLSNLNINYSKQTSNIFKKIYKNSHQSSIHIVTIDAFLLSVLKGFAFEASIPYEFDVADSEAVRQMLDEADSLFMQMLYSNHNLRDDLFYLGSITGTKKIDRFLSGNLNLLFNMRAELGDLLKDSNFGSLNKELSKIGKLTTTGKDRLYKFLENNISSIGKRSRTVVERFGAAGRVEEFSNIFKKDITEISTYRKIVESGQSEKFLSLWKLFKESVGSYFETKVKIDQAVFMKLLSKYQSCYETVLMQHKSLSFADIKNSVYNLLVNRHLFAHPDYIYFKLDCRIDHLLIDEFQDTSVMQWSIILPIAEELISGVGTNDREGSFFYVGDPKQSIYRFRGAASELFDRPLMIGNIIKKTLDKNYRSDREIVAFINSVFRNMVVDGFNYEDVSAKSENDGYVYANFNDDFNELSISDEIFRSVKQIRSAGFLLSDIAILVDKNDQVDKVADYLMKHNVLAVSDTTSDLYHTNIGIIVTSILRYLIFPEPILKEQIVSYIDENEFGLNIKNIKKIVGIYDHLTVFRTIIILFKLDSYFSSDPNLYRIYDIAYKVSGISASYGEFVDKFENILKSVNKISSSASVGAIQVMTIHKSKGLEFDAVILPIFPARANNRHSLIVARDKNLKVESILLNLTKNITNYSPKLKECYDRELRAALIDSANKIYVSMTRAKHALYIFGKSSGLFKQIKKVIDQNEETIDGIYRKGKLTQSGKREIVKQTAVQFFKKITEKDKKNQEIKPIEGGMKSRIFGRAFHYAMETVDNFDNADMELCINKVKQKYMIFLDESEINEIKARVRLLLASTAFIKISKGEKYREKPFINNGKESRFDLMVKCDNKINIIDYKTHYDLLTISDYKNQVSRYKEIADKVYGGHAAGYLVFVENEVLIYEV